MNARERLSDLIGAMTYDFLKNGPIYVMGYRIVVAPDRPRMQLSERVKEVLRPEHVADHNAWLLRFFGTENLVKDGDVLRIDYDDSGAQMLMMNPRTYGRFKEEARCAS